jgi:surface antigen
MTLGKYALLAIVLLSGCQTFGGAKPVQPIAVDPSLPVEQTPTMLLEKLSGGLIGQKLGTSFERTDKGPALEAEYKALEQTQAGVAVLWENPKTKHSGSVVAAQPYKVGSQNCRQYTHTFTVEGPAQVAKGTACRNDDGSWTPLT